MRLTKTHSCDVLVVGAGIAGISAAISAAEMGRSVTLLSSTHIFSGSSFYPGTWGLGLIGPADEGDMADLIHTIQAVGCGMADPKMVETFVRGIHPAIEKVGRMGVKLRRADNSTQKEFIPCFDHKHRDWNGIEFESAREIFARRMEELGVVTIPHCEALELVQVEGRVCGAVVAEGNVLRYLGAQGVILASGGYGGLYKYHLNTADVTGLGQALALKAGCKLVNMEFMQMMPGYITPCYQTVFNEKAFRFTNIDAPIDESLLVERSTHGPFTARLGSREIDLALFHQFLKDEGGVKCSYTKEMRDNPPEFIKTYFDWLLEKKGVSMDTPIQVGIFAHAANGGIQISSDCATPIPGLFACGEVTGGMHGADRIGGLSTANGLVFGGIAGGTAAGYCDGFSPPETWGFDCYCVEPGVENTISNHKGVKNTQEMLKILRHTMFQHGMIERSEAGIGESLAVVNDLKEVMNARKIPTQTVADMKATRRLEGQLLTATAILKAIHLRCESRGSHYRSDHPETQEKSAPILVEYGENIHAYYKEGVSQ